MAQHEEMTFPNTSPVEAGGRENENSAHWVRVHIDGQPYRSLDPTAGKLLYKLGDVPRHRELFREMDGDKEDEVVPRNETLIRLGENAHFYSQKAVTLIVNGEPTEYTETRISFEDAVNLAFPIPPTGQCIEFTVTYRNGPPANPKGTLTAGHSVKVKNKMVIDVTPTDRS